EKAPTILFRHTVGQIAQSNDGKLVVYPGTILHLECLWIRKYGTPHWEVSHKNRKYPEGKEQKLPTTGTKSLHLRLKLKIVKYILLQ
ncbi:hypothetical protein AVEN_187421-1, partial [Araneus ventricosus]